MLEPPHRFRRFAALAAVALTFGVAAHTACQAIEHHDGVKDVVALCAAAVALIAAVQLGTGVRRRTDTEPFRWLVVLALVPAGPGALALSRSRAWLQSFRN